MEAEIKGWNELYIRDVPVGYILNKNGNYPLIRCGTWISEDGKWQLREMNKEEYMIVPNTEEAQKEFFTKLSFIVGSLESCLSELNNLFYE